MLATAYGRPYRAYESLDAAQADPDAAVVMEGDYGGSVYLTCPVRHVGCDAAMLDRVLAVFDELGWDDPEGARVYLEHLPAGTGVAGGSGGGAVVDGVWTTPDLEPWYVVDEGVPLAEALADVVLGRRMDIPAQPYAERHGSTRSELPRSSAESSPGVIHRPDGDAPLG